MKNHKNTNLHVVREDEDPADQLVENLIKELNEEDGVEDPLLNGKERRKKRRRRAAIRLGILLLVVVGIYLLITLQTYTKVRISDTFAIGEASSSSYAEFESGFLKYSRDGISYLNQKGAEQWNQSYQIKKPTVIVGNSAALVYDQGGNTIEVITKEGVKGEIETNMPIEHAAVSSQGIVGAILKNSESAMVMCYDAKGNVLVEHKSSISGTGYPINVALSNDGNTMEVLYLYTQDGKITSKILYYNFGTAGEEKTDHIVSEKEYEDTIMSSAFFMDENTSVAVGDNLLAIYSGTETPKESTIIKIDGEIKNVFHNNKYIGLIVKNKNASGYELRLYKASGKEVLSKSIVDTYDKVKISGGHVILYDGKKCSIYKINGIHRFEGSMDSDILEILPVSGVNRYVVMTADGLDFLRLVK